MPVGDAERRALVRRPSSAGPEPAPLVLMFHGAGSTAQFAAETTGWCAAAGRHGFVVAFPEGTPADPSRAPEFRTNPQAWNDGSGRGHAVRAADDVAFTRALLDELGRRMPLDPGRRFVTGFSNGASLAWRLGVELAADLAAIAPVAGHLWLEAPAPARVLPALVIMGGSDPLNPVAGGPITTPWGRRTTAPPARRSFDRWRALAGCPGAPAVEEHARWLVERSPGCAGGVPVEFRLVHDLGHAWPGGPRVLPSWIGGPASDALDGAEAIWGFFAALGAATIAGSPR